MIKFLKRFAELPYPVKVVLSTLVLAVLTFTAYRLAFSYDSSGIANLVAPKAGSSAELAEGKDMAKNSYIVEGYREGDFINGPKDAKFLVIEYSDLECPFCKQNNAVLERLRSEFPNDVARIFRHLPIDELHPSAREEALVAQCVGQAAGDDAYYSYIASTFAKTVSSGRSFTLAESIARGEAAMQLPESNLAACVKDKQIGDSVNNTAVEMSSQGLRATPMVFVITKKGEYFARGYQPYGTYRRLLNTVL